MNGLYTGLGLYKKENFDFSQNLIRTPPGDLKQVAEDFRGADDLVMLGGFFKSRQNPKSHRRNHKTSPSYQHP